MNVDPYLRRQYASAVNLDVRIQLHSRFQTNRYGWTRWVFDRFDLPADARVLEIGCGNGVLWSANQARIPSGWDITLTDASAGMLEDAGRNLADVSRPFTRAVVDVHNIPFPDGQFDAVIANHMLYHVTDLPQGLCQIQRVLKPAGRLFATTNGADHMRELRDLVRPFAPNLPFIGNINPCDGFGLENGEALLAPFFPQIAVHHYPDSLEVTETEPLLAYVLSVRGAAESLTESAIAEIRQRIDQRLARDGMFRITKRQGMFVAIRSQS